MNKRMIRKVCIYRTLVLCVLSSLLFSSVVYAKEDPAMTGGVRISVETYTKCDGDLHIFAPPKDLQPGQAADYFIEVTNHSMDAYVRVQVRMEPEFCNPKNVLSGVDLNWKYTNNAFYSTRPLKQGESMLLCTGLKVPNRTDFDEEGLKIKIDAGAIQAENFRPDFTKADPWNGIEPQNVKKGGAGLMEDSIYRQERGISISGKGEKADFLSKEMILKKAGNLMPGDDLKDEVSFEAKKGRKYRLCANYEGEWPPENEKMMLTVKKADGSTLYEGSLFSGKLKQGVTIGRYDESEPVTLFYALRMDEGLGNLAAWERVPVSFEIRSSSDRNEKEITVERDMPTWQSASPETQPAQGIEKILSPDTGDEHRLLLPIFGMLSAAAVIAFACLLGHKKENGRNE